MRLVEGGGRGTPNAHFSSQGWFFTGTTKRANLYKLCLILDSNLFLQYNKTEVESVQLGYTYIYLIWTNVPRTNVAQTQSWKSGEHGEHAPGTPKVFPRNTQGKELSKRCLDSVSSHMFCKNSYIFQYFLSSACSIELGCPIVHKQRVHFALGLKEYLLLV